MPRVQFTVNYIPDLSKNRRYAYRTQKVKNQAHTAAQDMISYKFKKALRDAGIEKPKKQDLWVAYTWHRKNMRGDASNFLNPINDAIKKCLDFDDNWFSGMYSWTIDKENPRISITVYWEEV